jgi:hypothetical protein
MSRTAQTSKLEFQPGIIKDDTPLAAEGGYVSGSLVRFRRGRWQVIGGWEDAGADAFTNPVRGAKAWASLSGDKILAYGTSDELLTLFGGSTDDVTPNKYRATLTDPFATVNGSDIVTVTAADHGLRDGDSVTFALAASVGGLSFNDTFTVTRVLSLDKFTITASSNASSTASGGGKVEVAAALDAGLVDGTGGTGWGTGTYGSGFYGYPTGGDVDPRVWSLDNWGNDLVAIPRLGALYEFRPVSVDNPNLITLAGGTGGTGWTFGSSTWTATAGSASKLTWDVTGDMSGGTIYELVLTVTRSAGTLQVEITSDTGSPTDVSIGESIDESGTYTRRFRAPASPTTFKLAKDASFAGTVTAVSVTLPATATRVQSAPQYSIGGFVDPNRIMVCYGTVESDGDYNPMLVRWSNQEDLTTWLPADDNLAGEYPLARGSRIIGGIATRGQNLIWTDEGLYSMRFTGNAGDVFQFTLVGTGCGLIGKNAAAEVNGVAFWWGRNGQFYVFQGSIPQIIDCPVRRDVTDNLAFAQNEKIWCGVNSEFNEVWWFYPDARDGTNECSRYVSYNWTEDHWSVGELARSAWVPPGVFEDPIGFGIDGKVYFHERGTTANGATMPWEIESAYFNIQDGNNVMHVTRFMPDFEDQAGNIDMTLTYRYWPNGDDIAFGPYTITPTTREVLFRHTGRQAKVKFAAGTNSRFVRAGVHSFDVIPGGAVR